MEFYRAFSATTISHIDSRAATSSVLSGAPHVLAKFETCPAEIKLMIMRLVSFFVASTSIVLLMKQSYHLEIVEA
jgi:hypothetical protein